MAYQLELFSDNSISVINQPNEYGIIEPEEIRRFMDVELRFGRNIDGRWMWAVSFRFPFQDGAEGHGWALSAKWNKFSASYTDAIADAIEYMKAQIKRDGKIEMRVLKWLNNGAKLGA